MPESVSRVVMTVSSISPCEATAAFISSFQIFILGTELLMLGLAPTTEHHVLFIFKKGQYLLMRPESSEFFE